MGLFTSITRADLDTEFTKPLRLQKWQIPFNIPRK